MEPIWVKIHRDGILCVPDIPETPGESSDYMWLVVDDTGVNGYGICDGYDTGWWEKSDAWFAKPLRKTSVCWPGNNDIYPWVSCADRVPDTNDPVLVFDRTGYSLEFVYPYQLRERADSELFWYEDNDLYPIPRDLL